MICAYCNNHLPKTIEGILWAVTGECPSRCDAEYLVDIKCPSCKKVIYRKPIFYGGWWTPLASVADILPYFEYVSNNIHIHNGNEKYETIEIGTKDFDEENIVHCSPSLLVIEDEEHLYQFNLGKKYLDVIRKELKKIK